MHPFRTLAAVVATLALVGSAHAQSVPRVNERETPDAYPPALPRREGPPPPSMTFEEVRQLPLPGPLPAEPMRREGDALILPVAGGVAFVSVGEDVSIRLSSSAPSDGEASGDPWVVGPGGRSRYRTLPEGRVVAQKRKRKRWKRAWSLRVAGGTPAPPLVVGPRLVFGSLDNQVYAVRRDNGHRLWAVDVGDRVSHPLSRWSGTVRAPDGDVPVELILLVPDTGSSLLALDVHDGSRVATLTVADEDRSLAPPAVTVAEQRILVAAQRYAREEAALLVLRLRPAAEDGDVDAGEPVAYNDRHPPEGGSSE